VLAALALAAALQRAAASPPSPPFVDVGTRRLFRCTPRDSGVAVAGYCDVVRVPLAWSDPNSGTIGVRFEWIPAARPGARQTIVAQTGGPGFASTGDGDAFTRLFRPLLRDRNLLLMDERGTGASTPIDCEPLQRIVALRLFTNYQSAVERCGVELNRTFRTRDGRGYVHASELFSTPESVRDLAAIVQLLKLGPVDLYGVSYGTFFAQTFAARYPAMVRTLTLDSPYPLGQDQIDLPWRAEIRFALATVCARSAACSAATPRGSVQARIRRVIREANAGRIRLHSAGMTAALDRVFAEASLSTPPIEYRDLAAAALAFERGYASPLFRLIEESRIAAMLPLAPQAYSAGMEVADECTVYRNPFDLRLPFARRVRQRNDALAGLPAGAFDPLTLAGIVSMPDESFNECLRWPAPVYEEALPSAVPLVPSTLPVLMLSGELDATTAPGDARIARRQLGPSARLVWLPNTTHASSTGDEYGCAERIVRSFITTPQAPPDVSCTARIPEIRAVGSYPLWAVQQPPAASRHGDRARPDAARVAALAVATVGDAVEQLRFMFDNGGRCGRTRWCALGLQAGSAIANARFDRIRLEGYRLAADAPVDGDVTIRNARFRGAPGIVTAHVSVRTDDAPAAWWPAPPRRLKIRERLTLRWDERVPRAQATIEGTTQDGRPVRETAPAP